MSPNLWNTYRYLFVSPNLWHASLLSLYLAVTFCGYITCHYVSLIKKNMYLKFKLQSMWYFPTMVLWSVSFSRQMTDFNNSLSGACSIFFTTSTNPSHKAFRRISSGNEKCDGVLAWKKNALTSTFSLSSVLTLDLYTPGHSIVSICPLISYSHIYNR